MSRRVTAGPRHSLAAGAGPGAPPTGAPSTDPGVPSARSGWSPSTPATQALTGLRAATKAAVGPYGVRRRRLRSDARRHRRRDGRRPGPPRPDRQTGRRRRRPRRQASDYSGTNTHEAGVDEPDLVKTDGRRIVTVASGTLRVVDAATGGSAGSTSRPTATRRLRGRRPAARRRPRAGAADQRRTPYPGSGHRHRTGPAASPTTPGRTHRPAACPGRPGRHAAGARPGPTSTAAWSTPARSAAMARVVVRSVAPDRLPDIPSGTSRAPAAANRAVIDAAADRRLAPPDRGHHRRRDHAPSQVGCDAISRPAVYSGTTCSPCSPSTSPAAARRRQAQCPSWPTATPSTATAPSLYVANDQRVAGVADGRRRHRPQPPEPTHRDLQVRHVRTGPAAVRRRRQRARAT